MQTVACNNPLFIFLIYCVNLHSDGPVRQSTDNSCRWADKGKMSYNFKLSVRTIVRFCHKTWQFYWQTEDAKRLTMLILSDVQAPFILQYTMSLTISLKVYQRFDNMHKMYSPDCYMSDNFVTMLGHVIRQWFPVSVCDKFSMTNIAITASTNNRLNVAWRCVLNVPNETKCIIQAFCIFCCK